MLIMGNKSFVPEDFDLTRLDHNQAPDRSAYWKIIFSYFSPKTYVVGTQKNRLNETVLLST